MSEVIDMFSRGPVPGVNPGGSPSATASTVLVEALREMANQIESGELPYTQLVVIGVDEIGTCPPHVFGLKISTRELVGLLEISKMLTLDAAWGD